MPLNIKLSDEELKKLSPKELKEYMTMRRRLEGKKTTTKKDQSEVKLKCSLAWIDRKNLKAGFAFQKLSEIQKRGIEALLRDTSTED